MSKETLVVRNFGPIKEAELEIRKIIVLIGKQAVGKSVLAKLTNILGEIPIIGSYNIFEKFEEYGIDGFLNRNTFLEYRGIGFINTFENGNFSTVFTDAELELSRNTVFEAREVHQNLQKKPINRQSPEQRADLLEQRKIARQEYWDSMRNFRSKILFWQYIPAERSIISLFSKFIYEFAESPIGIPAYLIQFANFFALVRDLQPGYEIPGIFAKYNFEEEDIIELNGNKTPLSKSSSGLQSIAPLVVFVKSQSDDNNAFVIEEPELNLYPSTQKALVEFLIKECSRRNNKLFITTHSPYILTTLNNCIEASNVLKKHPEYVEQVNILVSPEFQIDFEDIVAYYVNNGTVNPLMNEEYKIIDANAIDDISNELGSVFDQLLDLKYQNQP